MPTLSAQLHQFERIILHEIYNHVVHSVFLGLQSFEPRND